MKDVAGGAARVFGLNFDLIQRKGLLRKGVLREGGGRERERGGGGGMTKMVELRESGVRGNRIYK